MQKILTNATNRRLARRVWRARHNALHKTSQQTCHTHISMHAEWMFEMLLPIAVQFEAQTATHLNKRKATIKFCNAKEKKCIQHTPIGIYWMISIQFLFMIKKETNQRQLRCATRFCSAQRTACHNRKNVFAITRLIQARKQRQHMRRQWLSLASIQNFVLH